MPIQIADTGYPDAEVFLNSAMGVKVDSTSSIHNNIRFYFNEAIANIHNRYDLLVSCSSATIPFSCYNISQALGNNVLTITLLSQVQLTLADGQYNINDLVAAVNSFLSSLTLQNYASLSYSRNTGLCTLTNTGVVTNGMTVGAGLLPYLGFTLGSFSYSSIIATQQVDLRRTGSILVQIPELITDNFYSQLAGGTRTGIIARIPVDVNPGSRYRNIINWQNVTNYETKIGMKTLTRFHIRLLDDNLVPLDFRQSWNINLRIGVVTSKPTIVVEKRLLGIENGKQVIENVAVE